MKTKKQFGRARLVIIITVVLVVVGALGFVFWRNFLNQRTKVADNASSIVAEVYTAVSDKFASSTADVRRDLSVKFGPAYKPTGASYYVNADKGSELSVLDKSNSTDIAKFNSPVISLIDSSLVDSGMVKKVDNADSRTSVFESNGVICRLYDNNKPLELYCGNKSEYVTLVKDVATFVALYPDANNDAVYGQAVVVNSANGYSTANVDVSGYSNSDSGTVAMYYKSKVGDWKYFTSTPTVVSCSKFDSADIKAAYEGTYCQDDTTKEMIKVTR